jgi:DNA polymerase-3 subunit epsilon
MARRSDQPLRDVDWSARFKTLAEDSTVPMLSHYYETGVVSGDTALAEVPFVALDLETTDMDPRKGAIVSLGLVPFSLSRIRVREARYWVVRPRRELAEESVLIHHITHEELQAAPRFSAVLPELLDALAGRVVVVHYRRIERPFLEQVCRRWTGEGLEFPLIDTMAIEALGLYRQKGFWGQIGGWLGFQRRTSLRLGVCRERYNLPAYAAHHALTDALATAELFQAQVAWHFDPAKPLQQCWL